jgi:ketosteroid isomerase-like protein
MKAIVMLGVLVFAGCASRAYVEEDEVAWENCRNLLIQQAEAWNRGELEVFVLGYRKSPQTLFLSDDEVHVGFDEMLARYKKSYPDAKSMGQLSFESLKFMNIDATHLVCTGTFVLQDKAKPAAAERWGRFGLIFRKDNSVWKIAVDYTTRGVGTRPAGKVEPGVEQVEDKRNVDPAKQAEKSMESAQDPGK